MATNLLRFTPLLLIGASASAIGCHGYSSSYVPPPDGRPRLVWSDDKVVTMMANPIPGKCSSAVDSVVGGSELRTYRSGGTVVNVSGGFYAPVHRVGVVRVHGVAPVPRPVIIGHVGSSSGGIGSLGSGGGGGGGKGVGEAVLLAVVLAIVVLPFVAVGLAAGRPEPEKEVAAAIDRVNAHTDLARTEGSPCDELLVAGEVAQ